MAKIRYLNFFDIFKLKKMVSHLTDEKFLNYSNYSVFYPVFAINYILPVSLKFLQDSYVAASGSSLKAMLSLKEKHHNNKKWKIKKLLLAENAYEIGEQIINYCVSKYGAKGVETIEVEVNSTDKDIIDLFSKACGFRYCLDYQMYRLNKYVYKNRDINNEHLIFRPYKSSDKQNLADLYNSNILPYYKFPLSKDKEEFSEAVFCGLDKTSFFKFILEDKFSKQIRGYVQIETSDNYNFIIEIVLLPSYENYFESTITFAVSQIAKRANMFMVFLRNNRFHSNSQIFEKMLNDGENELIQTQMIFVKDFFKQIKEESNLTRPAIIYNELNGKPAYKI